MKKPEKELSRQRKWSIRKKKELIIFYGAKCNNPACQTTSNLQFAHIKPTGLNGMGRGYTERVLDIMDNIECYMLLCIECHKEFDRGKL